MTNDDVTDLALARLVDGGRFETLGVWSQLVSWLVAHDPAWGPPTVIGSPRIDGADYIVPCARAALPGHVCEFTTRYPFGEITQRLKNEKGEVYGVKVDVLGPQWAACLKGGTLDTETDPGATGGELV